MRSISKRAVVGREKARARVTYVNAFHPGNHKDTLRGDFARTNQSARNSLRHQHCNIVVRRIKRHTPVCNSGEFTGKVLENCSRYIRRSEYYLIQLEILSISSTTLNLGIFVKHLDD